MPSKPSPQWHANSGIFTESGWALDRPAAAVMVLGGDLSLGHAEVGQHPVLSYAGGNFPPEWGNDGVRFGGRFSGSTGCADALVWQQCRLTEPQRCSSQLLGATLDIAVSSGLKLLGKALPVDSSKGFDVEQIGGQTALKSLNRMLPTHLRNHAGLLHHVNAVLFENEGQANTALADGHFRPIAIVTANADNSLTLADFYGGEDGDLDVFRERFPVLPVLGTYGTGQIAPSTAVSGDSVNRLMQNAVVTALVSTRVKEEHVQPIA